MNNILLSILQSGYTYTELGEPRRVHSAISKEEGEWLQSTIEVVCPMESLEIGCAYGISSLYICEALAKVGATKHVIIDPYQFGDSHIGSDSGYEGIGLHNLKRARLDNIVEFFPELSHRCLPRLEAEGRKFDFAFIDGMHTFDYAFVDFFYIDKMLKPGGLVVFDDLRYNSIRKICRYILTNLPYVAAGPSAQEPRREKWVAALLSAAPRIRHQVKPEALTHDAKLGIPPTNFMALKKTAEDIIGDGPNFTRRWDFHKEF